MPPLLLSPQRRRSSLQRQLLTWQLGTVLVLLLGLGVGTLWNTERRTLELLRSARSGQAGAVLGGSDLANAAASLQGEALSDWLASWRASAGASLIAVWPEGQAAAFDSDTFETADALMDETGRPRVKTGAGVRTVGPERLYWQADDLFQGQRRVGWAVVAFALPGRTALWLATLRGLWPWLGLALLLSLLGTALLARRIRRVTRDLEPAELAALSEGQERLLQTVRDGVIELDAAGQVTLANAAAAQALGLTHLPQPVSAVWPALAHLDLGDEARQIPLPLRGNVMRLNVTPLPRGGLVAFSEWQQEARLAEELTQARTLVDAMRARAHEYGNRLHVVAGFLQLGQPGEALGVIQEELEAEQGLGAALAQLHEPRVAALIAGKMAHARDLRLRLTLDEGSELPADLPPDQAEALLLALGNYLENAFEALRGQPGGEIRVSCGVDPLGLSLEVRDNGAGVPAGLTPFTRGQTSKGAGRGTGLAATAALCRAAGGEVWTAQQGEWTVFGVNFENLNH